jgi:hypothetical protein
MPEGKQVQQNEVTRNLRRIILDTWSLIEDEDDLTDEEISSYSLRTEERLVEIRKASRA